MPGRREALILALAWAACGNPGGGNNPPPPPPPPPPMTMPSLQITAPAVVDTYTCAKLTVTAISASGQPATVPASTPVTLGGLGMAQAFATLADCQAGMPTATTIQIPSAATSVDFYLRTDAAETLTLQAQATGYTAGTATVTPTLFQVLGQPDTKTILNVELGEWNPLSMAVAGGKLLVADSFSNRVLIYDRLPAAAGVLPDVALGQVDRSSVTQNVGGATTSNATAASMHLSWGVATDGTHVFVADSQNHRVLVWNSFPTLDGQPADFALGQPAGANNLTANTANNGGVSGASLNNPHGVFTDGTRLLVADYDNNRVLVWKKLPTAPVAADFALGQPDGGGNLTLKGSGTTAASMKNPSGVWIEGTQLYVADTGNNRVLVWNHAPTEVVSADFALGQPAGATNLSTGTKNNGGVSGGSLSGPASVSSDGTRLYVADTGNNRVLVWHALPQTVATADYVLGQATLSASSAGTTATALDQPAGVFSDQASLFVADSGNNRVLIWDTVPGTSAAPADRALGQPKGGANLTSRLSFNGAISGATMNFPNAMVSDGTHTFVVDWANNRVLGWDHMPTSNDQPADFALGQPVGNGNLASNAAPSPPTAGSMWEPNDALIVGTRLFVADTDNNRVLVWNSVPTAATPADFALGQPAGAANLSSNTANNGGVSGAAMSSPYSLATDGTRLFVVDDGNNRVLVWNAIPSAPVAADFALGQPAGAGNLTSGTANNGGVSASSMKNPGLLFCDGKMLTLADSDNNRVLIWRTVPTAPVGADLVLGQPDFSHSDSGATAQTMKFPEHAVSDGKRLFVSDTNNNRVLVWDALPTTNGQAATAVIGQADLTSDLANRNGGVTYAGLNNPFGLRAEATRLFIVDTNNHRVLIVPTTGL